MFYVIKKSQISHFSQCHDFETDVETLHWNDYWFFQDFFLSQYTWAINNSNKYIDSL